VTKPNTAIFRRVATLMTDRFARKQAGNREVSVIYCRGDEEFLDNFSVSRQNISMRTRFRKYFKPFLYAATVAFILWLEYRANVAIFLFTVFFTLIPGLVSVDNSPHKKTGKADADPGVS
jgi:hypothetical protein